MTTQLRVDLSSPVPPFEQIRAGIAALIGAGQLMPDDRLPTVRSLAADLGVANGTVARAYRELEAAGFVVGRGRRGTAVAADPPVGPVTPGVRTTTPEGTSAARWHRDTSRAVVDAVGAAVETARAHDLPAEELIALVRAAYDEPPTAAH